MPTHPRYDEFINLFTVKRHASGIASCICPVHEDKQASLSISEGDRGIMVHCHAGCAPEDICAAVGWKLTDLFYEKKEGFSTRGKSTSTSHRELPPWERIQEVYPYVDASGQLIYESVRLHSPKGFTQRRPDPADSSRHIWNMRDTEPLPYQLPLVLRAIEQNSIIFIVEGEKDVHTLREIKCAATTNHGGAEKWSSSLTPYFQGAHVILIPDNDVPGCRHAMDVACKLHNTAASIRYLMLPDQAPKSDVSDWLKTHTAEEFLSLAESSVTWLPGTEIEPSPEAKSLWDKHQSKQLASRESKALANSPCSLAPGEFMLSDMGNAERLIAQHGNNLRYNVNSGQWMHWDGIIWREDNTANIRNKAIACIRSIYDDIAQLFAEIRDCKSADERRSLQAKADALQRHAMACESNARIKAMVEMAQSLPGIPVEITDLNSDPWLLCCQNGVVDLKTGELLEPLQHNLITKQIQITYDESAECPQWMQFLEQVVPDEEIRNYLQRAVGYTLTGDVSEQVLFFLFGSGRNGKSTFLEIVTDLLGAYFQKSRADTLMIRHNGGGIPNDLAVLAGARFVLASELASNQRLDEALVKDLTGGDTISARFLRQEFFTFRAGFKLWIYGNEKPRIREKKDGIWRRIMLIPFTVQIPLESCDRLLKDKLRAELPGILNWAIHGCLAWQRNGKDGLKAPQTVADAVNEYRDEQDPLASFLHSSCATTPAYPGAPVYVPKRDLYNAHKAWAEENGEQTFDSIRAFNNEIKAHSGIRESRGTGNIAVWRGVRLLEENEQNGEVTEVTENLGFNQNNDNPNGYKNNNNLNNSDTDDGIMWA